MTEWEILTDGQTGWDLAHKFMMLLGPRFRDDDRAYFIDFEYGGFNYLAYDIANHFNEHTGTDEDAVIVIVCDLSIIV